MKDQGKPTPEEVAEKEEYNYLFAKAKGDIEALTLSEEPDDLGIKRLAVELAFGDYPHFNFFWNERINTFGVEFSKEGEGIFSQAYYNFHLESGAIDITGVAGLSFGPESLPDLIYAPMDLPQGMFENVRHAPLPVDLPQLRDLVRFIDNPLRHKDQISALAKLPGEESLKITP